MSAGDLRPPLQDACKRDGVKSVSYRLRAYVQAGSVQGTGRHYISHALRKQAAAEVYVSGWTCASILHLYGGFVTVTFGAMSGKGGMVRHVIPYTHIIIMYPVITEMG